MPGAQQLSPGAVVVRGQLSCPGGIAGKTLAIAGLESTITDVLVRVKHADGRLESHLLRPTTPSVTFGGNTGLAERALGYVQLGFQHILLGADHLLFVLGLMLIVADRWMLVKTLTAFTVAHSITLALATLGYASAPLLPLNAAIALSILFLGPEIVRAWRGETSFTIRHPWVVAFAFGLLHGFGFASGSVGDGTAAGTRSRWRCCCSTSASNSASSPSCCWWCCSSARFACSKCAGRCRCSACPVMWSARWARSGRSSAR